MKNYPHHSSIGNLDANLVAFGAYVVPMVMSLFNVGASIAWIIPLVILIVEKESDFVNCHAAYSLTFFILSGCIHFLFTLVLGSLFLTNWIGNLAIIGFFYQSGVGILTLILGVIGGIFSLILFVCKLICLIKAYHYNDPYIPFISQLATFILNLKR